MAHRSRSTKFMATSLSLALVASATASAVTLRSAAIFWRDRGQQQREAAANARDKPHGEGLFSTGAEGVGF